jgi:ubiquinone/menaquinone biosynthesis C-methylase UbiE
MSSKEDNTLFFELLGDLETRETALKKLACKINDGERILDLATGSGYLVRNIGSKS